MPQIKMPLQVLVILTVAPALLVGATLWMANSLVPACTVEELSRLPSPEQQFDLVTVSRDCGDSPPNAQATLVPPGEEVPFDAASFFSSATDRPITPRWMGARQIELAVPQGAQVLRQDDAVAGISITYVSQ